MALRALVVGGAGFLGSHLVEMLVDEQFDVHVLDLQVYDGGVDGVTSQVGSVLDYEALLTACEGMDVVFHLASVVDVGLLDNPMMRKVNVDGVANVIRACKETGVQNLVYTSSEDVVLGKEPRRGVSEDEVDYTDEPVNEYVATKIEGEKMVLREASVALRTVALRPVHLYGERDPHAIPTTVRAVKAGTVPLLLGDGSAKFDVVYVRNVAHAHVLAARALLAGDERVNGSAYFVGEGNALNFFDFVRPYVEAAGLQMTRRRCPIQVVWVVACVLELLFKVLCVVCGCCLGKRVLKACEPNTTRFVCLVIGQDFYFSNEKARRELGYTPLVDPVEGQRRTAEWVRQVHSVR